MGRKVYVIGVGMVKFQKPGQSDTYDVMAQGAARAALTDASVDYTDIQQVYAGYVFGDSTCGQRAVYPLGLTVGDDIARVVQHGPAAVAAG